MFDTPLNTSLYTNDSRLQQLPSTYSLNFFMEQKTNLMSTDKPGLFTEN